MKNRMQNLSYFFRQKGIIALSPKDVGKCYLLVDWPMRCHGPAFDAYPENRVGAYVIPVIDGEFIPTGTIEFAIWGEYKNFELGKPPVIILPMEEILKTEEQT